jgi:hypothetical protein
MMDNKDERYWEQIDEYLDGEIRGEDRTAFRQRLSEEPVLAKDTLFQQQMRQGIAFGSQQALRSRLQTIHEETLGEGPEAVVSIGRTLWLRWAVAAAMILGALGILFWVQEKPSGPEELFAANYEVYELDYTTRSPGEENPESLALATYRNRDYPAAIQQLERVLENDSENPSLQLALAISYWENKQPEQAQSTLRPLFDHPLLKDQAYWYAALFALAQDRKEQALEYLNKIAEDSGKIGRQAAELRQELTK